MDGMVHTFGFKVDDVGGQGGFLADTTRVMFTGTQTLEKLNKNG